VVERRELARNAVGVLEVRVDRGHEADVLGLGGDGRQQGERLELKASARAALSIEMVARAPDEVGQEEGVELRLLRALRRSHPVARVGTSVVLRARVSPRRRVVPEAHEERIENQLPLCHHISREEIVATQPSPPLAPCVLNATFVPPRERSVTERVRAESTVG
jgi:hypothetical protein